MTRNGLSLCRRTTVSQRVPMELAPRVVAHIQKIRDLRMVHKYGAKNNTAMDETGLWLDMPGRTSVEETGACTVAVKTTGHDKDRFTVVLAARADSSKLHPMLIFKGKRKDKSLDGELGVVVQVQEHAWMTEDLTLKWLRMLWGGVAATRERRLLVWDDFRAHKTDRVKTCANDVCNTDLVIVPAGCTSLLQAPDLSWNKPFKAKYEELYNEWSISGEKSYTAAGNMRPPCRKDCVRWVKAAWAAVTRETILRSFKTAAITVAVDGSEDCLISCLARNQDLANEVQQQL